MVRTEAPRTSTRQDRSACSRSLGLEEKKESGDIKLCGKRTFEKIERDVELGESNSPRYSFWHQNLETPKP